MNVLCQFLNVVYCRKSDEQTGHTSRLQATEDSQAGKCRKDYTRRDKMGNEIILKLAGSNSVIEGIERSRIGWFGLIRSPNHQK